MTSMGIVAELHRQEAIIERGWGTFVDVGFALSEIRDQKLYRNEFKTFEAYCSQRWGWTRQHASRLIGASDVVRSLSPMGDKSKLPGLPKNERVVRPLASLPAEERAEAWAAVTASGPATAIRVQQEVDRRLPLKDKKSRRDIPSRMSVIRAVVDAVERLEASMEDVDDELVAGQLSHDERRAYERAVEKMTRAADRGGRILSTTPVVDEWVSA